MLEWIYPIGGAGVLIALFAMMYRIVPPQEAHFVTAPWGTKVCSPDKNIEEQFHAKKWYFYIPILMTVRKMKVVINELVVTQETYEKNQARYNVKSSVKYRIKDIITAANTFINDEELQKQLEEVLKASVRAITVKYDVVDARALKTKMGEEIEKEMKDDLQKWGLELTNFQMIDFQDTPDSKIISNISRRREKEIETKTREEVAEKEKSARLKEAEADEKAREREILRDQVVGMKDQNKLQKIAEQEKIAQQKHFEVVQVQTVRQAEIDKEKAIVEANEKKATEEIFKDQKKLEGEGDRLRAEEQAKGEAAPIREKGFADAEAKEKLQAALNKFEDKAIRALVAEAIVAMQEKVGIETAQALAEADLRIFAGGEGDKSGFDLGKLISAASVSNEELAASLLNKIARPNDLGLSQLDLTKILPALAETIDKKKKEAEKKDPEKPKKETPEAEKQPQKKQ